MKTLFTLFLALFFVGGAQAQQRDEALRVQRLSELGKLWGTVKLLHPSLAYKDIDWDAALVQAIPKVDAAVTAADYRAAVDSMLAALGDPDTRTVDADKPADGRGSTATAPSLRWNENRVAILTIPDAGYFIGTPAQTEEMRKLFTEAGTGRGLIIDLRRPAGPPAISTYSYSSVVPASISLLTASFPTSGVRYRMHSGFPTQTRTSSGGYFNGVAMREGSPVEGRSASKERLPMAVIADPASATLYPLLAGLQSAGLARIVHVGAPEMAGVFTIEQLAGKDDVSVRVRLGEQINPDGSIGLQPDVQLPATQSATGADAAMAAALEALRPGAAQGKRTPAPLGGTQRPENFYRDTPYPDREHRLLALFRLWNTMDAFFPYKALMDRPWDEVLPEFVPKFEAAKDATEYGLAIALMVRNLQDSHVGASSPALTQYFGNTTLPIVTRLIENKTVIAKIWGGALKEAPQLKVGDVILSVDGEAIAQRRERIGRYLTASTPHALAYKTERYVLAASNTPKAVLEIEDAGGKRSTVTLSRAPQETAPPRQMPVYTVLKEGYGYFDLTRLTPADLDTAFEAVKNTPGLILDMRGYPRGVFFQLGMRLARKPAIAALFERPEIQAIETGMPLRRKFMQEIQPSGSPYAGKVVMLINEEAISQSEHTCLFVESATDVTFIGTPTQGANGDVTTVLLPGAVSVSFTGHDVRHGDGRQLQRLGIQPKIRVAPTVKGMQAGRDEVLEKALEFLRQSGRK